MNILRLSRRAAEMVLDRAQYQLEAVHKQAAEARGADVSQRDKRAAYEQAAGLTDDRSYAAARAEFEATFGPQEWERQETFALRRQAQARAERSG